MNSRAKGKRGELMLVHELERLGMLARRGQQYAGAYQADVLVEGLGVHIEAKNTANIRMRDWVLQASRDAKGLPWAIMYHLPRSVGLPNGKWLVITEIDAWSADSRSADAAREHKRTVVQTIVQEAVREGF